MSIVDSIARRLREAGTAHHRAFAATDGDDPEWPLWYADHLREAVSADLGRDLTRSELVYLLVSADRSLPADTPWPDHYASVIASAG